MSKRTNRALLAGLAGAVGVVTSTQLPNVQAAMEQLSQQDASASSSQTIGNDPIHQAIKQDLKRQTKNGQHQITTKTTIVRERAAAQKKAKVSRRPIKRQASENLTVAQAKTVQEPSTNVVELAAAQSNAVAKTSSEATSDTPATVNVAQSSSQQTLAAAPATQPSEQTEATSTPAEQAAYDEVVTDQSQAPDTIQYTIADGDTLSGIAAAHGVTTADIYAANKGDLGLLQIGQVISLPKTSTHAEGTVTDSVAKPETPVGQADSIASSQANTASTQVSSQQDGDHQAASTSNQAAATVKTANGSQPNLQATPKVNNQTTATQTVTHTASQAQPVTTSHNTQAVAPQAPVAVKAGSLSASQRSTIVSEAISLAQQNIPYVWGGKTTSGFDCSGLVAYVYGQAGASLPAYTVAQEGYVSSQDVHSVADVTAKAQPGDILFWGGHGSTWHSAIYIGGGQFVAAPQPGSNVSVQSLSADFLPDFVGTLN